MPDAAIEPSAPADDAGTTAARKPGAAREATLNAALAGAGAGGAPLAQLRARAQTAYDALELPRWRRSGFWQTSFQELDLDALAPITRAPDATVPAILGWRRARRRARPARRLGRARRSSTRSSPSAA